MACAPTTGEDRRVNTDPIVPYAYSQIRIPKGDFGLNMSGVRVLVCVADRFAGNPIDVVSNTGTQLARLALDHDSVLGRCAWLHPDSALRTQSPQHGRQLAFLKGGGAQVLYGITPLANGLVSHLHGRVQEFCGIAGAFGEQLPNRLQSEHQTLEALQQ